MTSANFSPLSFTLAYQRYRGEVSRIPFADTRLLAAARFWSANAPALNDRAFSTYWLEDIPPILANSKHAQLEDLEPEELEEIAVFVEQAEVVSGNQSTPPDDAIATSTIPTPSLATLIWERASRKWLFLGEASRSLAALAHAGRLAVPSPAEVAQLDAECSPLNAIDIPEFLAASLEMSHPDLSHWLRDFNSAWSGLRDSGVANQASCILVEYDANGRPVRGRVRRLKGKIETLSGGHDSDEVIFHHQVKSPDDPFVGSVYAAIKALSSRNARPNAKSAGGTHYRAQFTFDRDGDETYSGDSVGLAAFAIAFGDEWGHEVHRERRLIGQTVAFTGGVGRNGSVQPASPDSLNLKIARAFHSPVTHVVVPEANRPAAVAEAERLRQIHPRRRLHIIGIDRPSDIITDHNIFLTEKLWPGEFAFRKATGYARSVKVQVPVLMVLGYLLLCLVYPKAWVLFDWNPAKAEFVAERLVVRNNGSQELWGSLLGNEFDLANSFAAMGNLDEDSQLEICCLLTAKGIATGASIEQLIVFDDDGREFFRCSPVILNEYPGDTSLSQRYERGHLSIHSAKGQAYIIAAVVRPYPARAHIKVWDNHGNVLGWYINAGYATPLVLDTSRGILHCPGVNNRVSAACVFSIWLDSSYGASPPYTDPVYDLSSVKRGNQLQYIVFPKTDLCDARNAAYNAISGLMQDANDLLRCDVDELGAPRFSDSAACVNYYVDPRGRVIDARCEDAFHRARDEMVSQGKLAPVDWDEYERDLVRKVMYWSDKGWVSQE